MESVLSTLLNGPATLEIESAGIIFFVESVTILSVSCAERAVSGLRMVVSCAMASTPIIKQSAKKKIRLL